jgi:hypothetical protein
MPLGFLRWPVVLAIVVLFVLLRLRRARSFAWALACFASIYAFARAHGLRELERRAARGVPGAARGARER